MRLAFCIFKYFPFGGLQRDFLEIILRCQQRGHDVTVFTIEWTGPIPAGLHVEIIPTEGFANHTKCFNFAKNVFPRLKAESFDCAVGFNKMAGLDLYYAGDPCYRDRARKKHWCRLAPYYWASPRFRRFVALEKAVFGPRSRAEIMLLNPAQQSVYMDAYGTTKERFHHLPPGICQDRKPVMDSKMIRAKLRREFLRPGAELLLLMVGVGWRSKGLDRALCALSALPSEIRRRTAMLAIGENKSKSFGYLASRLGIADLVTMLPARQDIPRFYLGADLLIHPAYSENTGGVILESMVYGLPILTTDVCGYARHVLNAKAGLVVSSPYSQEVMNQALLDMLTSPRREKFSVNGVSYTKSLNLYTRAEQVADMIENWVERKNRGVVPSA